MTDFRENYFIAREIVANELKEKYSLIESYKDEDRLTLDSSNHSVHFILYLQDGLSFSISNKGKMPLTKDSYFGHIAHGRTLKEIDVLLVYNATKFEPISKEIDGFKYKDIVRYFYICLLYFETEHPEFFY